jgi:uncharacterized protein YkwD
VDAATECLIDRVRAVHHLHPLRSNRYLQRVASTQACRMVRWNYFSDISPSGRSPAALISSTRYAAHAGALATGQNIGWATANASTPAQMVSAWMRSPPHRAVILARAFYDVGAGVTAALPAILHRGPFGAVYAVEFAGRRR